MKLTKEHYHAMIFYDFKLRLNQEKCLQHLQLAYENESPAVVILFRWLTQFCGSQNSLLYEEHRRRPLSAVEPENLLAMWKNVTY